MRNNNTTKRAESAKAPNSGNVLSMENGSDRQSVKAPANPYAPDRTVQPVKIIPNFEEITDAGLGILRNLDNLKNAKTFLDTLADGIDLQSITGLMLLLDAIRARVDDDPSDAAHFLIELQTFLFSKTLDCDEARRMYVKAVKAGNITVEHFITSDSAETEIAGTQTLKAVA